MTGRDRPIIDKVSSTFRLTFAPSPQLEVCPGRGKVTDQAYLFTQEDVAAK